MIKAVLFDVDGVMALGESFGTHLSRDHGIPKERTAPFFRGRFVECLMGKADLKDELAPHLPSWGWRGTIDDLLHDWFTSEHVVNEPLVNAAQQLRKRDILCCIATNQEKYRTRYIHDQMGFGEKFDEIFSSAHIGHMKNDPVFFAYVLRKLAPIQAHEVVFWDDSAINVAVARAVGLHGEVYSSLADFEQKMRGYLARSD